MSRPQAQCQRTAARCKADHTAECTPRGRGERRGREPEREEHVSEHDVQEQSVQELESIREHCENTLLHCGNILLRREGGTTLHEEGRRGGKEKGSRGARLK